MMYEITTTSGRVYRTTGHDLRQASWVEIGDQDVREITTHAAAYGRGADEPGRLCVVCPAPDCGDWSGHETAALRVRDEHGRVEEINFSATVIWSDDGRTEFFVGNEAADVTDEWGASVAAADLLAVAGLPVSAPDVDYKGLAEDFCAANPEARYLIDEGRGFANEWTLIVRSGARQDDEDALREITPDEAVQYLADAVMDRRDYEAIHGCEPYVAAVMED